MNQILLSLTLGASAAASPTNLPTVDIVCAGPDRVYASFENVELKAPDLTNRGVIVVRHSDTGAYTVYHVKDKTTCKIVPHNSTGVPTNNDR